MTVYRVWLYRRAHALVCVEADSEAAARELAGRVVTESDWQPGVVTSEVQQRRKDWPADVYWTGTAEAGKWVYPETSMFEEGQ